VILKDGKIGYGGKADEEIEMKNLCLQLDALDE